MIETAFPESLEIISSTADVFPVMARIRLDRIQPDRPRVRFLVKGEGSEEKELFQDDLPEVTVPGAALALRGIFQEKDRTILLVTTLCLGQELGEPRYVCGLLFDRGGGIADGAIGVWVAEERPTRDPRDGYI